jgi:hypothetical protein
MYRVLLTVNADGEMLTHLPTAERLVGKGHQDYQNALTFAKTLRTALYQHKKTGEQRLLSELETTGSAYRDDDEMADRVWRFVKAATYLAPRSYALVVDEKDLPMFEPKADRA